MSNVESGFFGNPDLLAEYGPVVQVDIGHDPDFEPSGRKPPELESRGLLALVDTGALECAIDLDLAIAIRLPRVDDKVVSGIHGPVTTEYYSAQIFVPGLPFTIHGDFAALPLRASGHPQSAILGRTFLMHFSMIYNGRDGGVIITDDHPAYG